MDNTLNLNILPLRTSVSQATRTSKNRARIAKASSAKINTTAAGKLNNPPALTSTNVIGTTSTTHPTKSPLIPHHQKSLNKIHELILEINFKNKQKIKSEIYIASTNFHQDYIVLNFYEHVEMKYYPDQFNFNGQIFINQSQYEMDQNLEMAAKSSGILVGEFQFSYMDFCLMEERFKNCPGFYFFGHELMIHDKLEH